MKKIIVSVCFLGMLASCSTSGEKIEQSVMIKKFGPVNVDDSKAVSTQSMLSKFDPAKGEQEFTFEGKITEVCSKAGCWVNVDKGNGETFMVRFKDHFTIPTNTKVGEIAFIHGIAYMDTIPVEDLRHYAEDAGKSKAEIEKITKPEFELNFEADGIMFKTEKKTVTKS